MQQRPLLGEPLPIDLLNTQWLAGGVRFDLLDDPATAAGWLASWGLPFPAGDLPRVIAALLEARTALARHIASPADPAASRRISELLDGGRLRLRLDREPVREAEVADPAARPAWEALRGYLDLLDERPGRVRKCANPPCLLHFVDATPRNARRWCSMEGCGNRVKARRHYARRTSRGG